MALAAFGITVEPPAGWEARIFRLPDGEATLHAASFALPVSDGEYGSTATARMPRGGAFLSLTEFLVDSHLQPTTGLFANGRPTTIHAGDFSPNALLRTHRDQLGLQRFFSESGRPFALYLVVGSRAALSSRLPELRAALESLTIRCLAGV